MADSPAFAKEVAVRGNRAWSLCLVAGGLLLASPMNAEANISTTWNQLNPTKSPPGRISAALAYDSATQQMILFGGCILGSSSICTNMINDTWKWNGYSWAQLAPKTSPSARASASLAWDPATKQLILFGGADSNLNLLNDTWLWTGTTWRLLSPASKPSPRGDPMMGWDPATHQMVLFSGCTAGTNGLCGNANDTWIWTGTTWKPQSPLVSPVGRYSGALSYDHISNKLILFGGWGFDRSFYSDTWAWTGTTWQQLNPSLAPPARARATMSTDPVTSHLILFGGWSNSFTGAFATDTWTWTGTTWQQLAPLTSPPGRADAVMTTGGPSTRRQLILFGGVTPTSLNASDTWQFKD